VSAEQQISWDAQPQSGPQIQWDDEPKKDRPEPASLLSRLKAQTESEAPKSAWQAVKEGLTPFAMLKSARGMLQNVSEWAGEKASATERENEASIAQGGRNAWESAAPGSADKSALLDLLSRTTRFAAGAASPKNLAMAGATAVAPEVMGPALVGHGLLTAGGNAKEALQGNPESAEAALGGLAEAAGGGAATGSALTTKPTVGASLRATTTGRALAAANKTLIKGQPPDILVPGAQKALSQALQLGVNVPKGQQSIATGGPRIQQLLQAGELQDLEGQPLGRIDSAGDVLAASRGAKRAVLTSLQERMGPVKDLQPDTSRIGDAMEGTITKRMERQNPAAAAQIRKQAQDWRDGGYTLGDLEDSIVEMNDELKPWYKQATAGENSLAPSARATLAGVRAARQLLDETMESLTGEGVADLKREYGALRDIEKGAARQYAIESRTKEGGLWEGLSYLHAAGDIASGNLLRAGTALTVGRWLKALRSPSQLIEQSFHGAKAFNPAEPIGKAPGLPESKGLLGQPATAAGWSNEDTSGPIRGGRYTTPAALLPDADRATPPISTKFLRTIPRGEQGGAASPTGLLPESTAARTNIPPAVDPRFLREVARGPRGNEQWAADRQLGTVGEGGIRLTPRAELPGVAESTVPDEAKLLVQQTLDVMRSADRPGRYFDESAAGEHILPGARQQGIDRMGGSWRSVGSLRGHLPWMNETEFAPGELEDALESLKEGRVTRVMRSAMDYVRREAQGTRVREPGEDVEATGGPGEREEVKVSKDSNGIRWAESRDGFRVSVPSRIPDSQIEEYAQEKLREQRRIFRGMKGEEAPF
jgi:hypothetical protein